MYVVNIFFGRDAGNRTPVIGFGDRSPTTERRPYILWSPLAESNRGPLPYHGSALPSELSGHLYFWCRVRDSDPRRRKPADLQSAPFDHFGNSAHFSWSQRWDLNPRPNAYKALALPLSYSGAREFERQCFAMQNSGLSLTPGFDL